MKLLSLFSGIGAPEQALKNIGVDVDLVGFSEIDKYAVKSYCKVHGVNEELNLGDITKIDISKLPKDIDLVTHGSPCFIAGTKVLTDSGYKNIEDVSIGDKVITHSNEYKEVYETMVNNSDDIYEIITRNSFPIRATGNHPFYVREKKQKYINKKIGYKNIWGKAEWKWLRDLNKNYYVGVAINNKSELPNWIGVPDNRNNHSNYINNLKDKFKDNKFWYFVGRFIGDGWATIGFNKKENKPTYRTTICCSKDELEDLKIKIDGLFNYTIVEDRTVYKLQFMNKELTLYLEQFGKGASNKRLIKDIFNLPIEHLKSFIDGYIDSDGCLIDNGYRITSVSEELILGIGECIAKVYKVPYSLYKTKRPKKYIIEGREVNQKDTYSITFKKDNYKEGFVEGNILWMPIREVKKIDNCSTKVYNLEVKDNHSYTVNNIIVHNCQSFSVAGKQEGGDEGSGTRSSLMWNTVEIVEECKPKYVLWENVKNVLSKRHRHNFDKYLNKMSNLGYRNYYQVLNAKDYGIPQNRERVFVISIREDIDQEFCFPSKMELNLKLKDMLEDNVEDKYYLSEDKVRQLVVNCNGVLDLNKKVVGTCHPKNDLSHCQRDIVYSGFKDSSTLTATMYKDAPKVITSCNSTDNNIIVGDYRYDEGLRIRKNNMRPCLTLKCGDGSLTGKPLVIKNDGLKIRVANKTGYQIANEGDGIDLEQPNSNTRRGRIQKDSVDTLNTSDNKGAVIRVGQVSSKGSQAGMVYSSEGVSQTLCSGTHGYAMGNILDNYRIRKLTPKECWRLMGFKDEQFAKAEQVCSNTQLYKQAGNSIVVNVLEEIFKNLIVK